jgi:HK97 family phage prohead protease
MLDSLVGKFITKKRTEPDSERQHSFKFRAASEDEIKKELGVDEVPEGYIAGWASTPDLDHAGDVVLPGAFDESIKAKGLQGPHGIKLLLDHKMSQPAGAITKLETRDGKLWIEAQLDLRISYVKDRYYATKAQGGMSFSVGFFIEEYTWKKYPGTDWEYLEIEKGELFEVSVVPMPMNDNAAMMFVKDREGKDAEFETIAQLEKALVASGLVKSRNDAARVTRVVKANPALFGNVAAPVPPKDAPAAPSKSAKRLEALAGELKSLFGDKEE